MKKLNIYLALIALVLCVVIIIRKNDLTLNRVATLMAISTPQEVFDFNSVDSMAKLKLKSKFNPTPEFKIPGLDGISYDDYRQIEYKPDVAIWKNLALPYQLHFFHPGHIYSNGIQIYEVINEKPIEIPYDASRFNFGDLPLTDSFTELTKNLQYTGFRVHYPINQKEILEEFLVFQGSSYFRAISKGQVYGLSGRGLAINTGPQEKEEFPIFESFYIKRPQKTDTTITIYAIMNSESVVGSYEFLVKPGEVTTIDVKAKIYLRKKIKRLGFAPITSMYLYGESDNPILGNIHPEVHDSDGLLIQNKMGDWEWRPLINPKKTQLTRIPLDSPRGYGLIQRDRKFKSYQDEKLKYHLRPSLWVEPKGDWGKGNLYLLEFTTNLDSDDNITTFWEPSIPPNLNEGYEFQYTLHYTERSPKQHTLGKASAFYRGVDPLFPKEKVFTLYFTGDYLKSLDKKTLIKAVIQNDKIPPEQIRYRIEKISELDQWRLQIWYPAFVYESNWYIFLENQNQRITETWIYRDGLSK
ncbi:glucan biosynthesis protein [Leptospira bandrabouensis]|uniref:glucan biosynthesis protein n=1 Tax=Leptospira bandrabouensis TaxID=2484903 RepID=UPI00223C93EE|nr:glucan biosynthesis protein [Leptospira bandrabouensis]MCW7459832.1 glucan biosynthesis protein [Leptospira bandrabouensis]MCW7479257.1 glucan biosynthesis protein [Leptospira bandrabouensis]MCW7486948.1 glucan biosynthesis protein [Leptospira bandrabouensis]